MPKYRPNEVVISMPCHKLLLPGDTTLHGYLGHNDLFEEQGGRACQACHGRPLAYSGYLRSYLEFNVYATGESATL